MKKLIQILGCLGAAAVLSPAVSITSSATGSFFSTDNSGAAGRFGAGQVSGGGLNMANFAVFDLTGQSGTVTAATLTIFQGPTNSINPTFLAWAATYSVWNVSTSVASLTGGGNVSGAYADLSGGTSFGSTSYSTSDTSITVTFNSAGLAALTAALGGNFALGGTLTGQTNGGNYAFDYVPSGGSLPVLNFTLTAGGGGGGGGGNQEPPPTPSVPEPGTLALMGTALLATAIVRRRK